MEHDEIQSELGQLCTRMAVAEERLNMGDYATKLAKRRTWLDWLLQGVGIIGLVAVLVAFQSKASSTDLTLVSGRVSRVEAIQAGQAEALAGLLRAQGETTQAIKALADEIKELTRALLTHDKVRR